MDSLINSFYILSEGTTGVAMAGIIIIVAVLALIRNEPGMMVLAALLLVPIAYVAGAWTGFLLVIRLMPIFLLLAALAIANDEPVFSWSLPLFPFGYLIYFIFNLLLSSFPGF
ncbi:MAG TPA: hypothetical protein PLF42_11105 [Anaerolineales bacterium]|jgi:hypothetical protein|nr:hypothetical protein [Anaerolineales bacterium]